VKWYRKAAEHNAVDAQNNLGVAYLEGHGVIQDYSTAAQWFLRAARRQHPSAQYNLGVIYRNGWGWPRDDVEACAWFTLAAARGHRKAAEVAATMRKLMTEGELAKAAARAKDIETSFEPPEREAPEPGYRPAQR
jgi:TPR repeat protein